MKSINDYIQVNEGLKLDNSKLEIIKKFLNNQDDEVIDKELTCEIFNNTVAIGDDILTDIAGYIVEAWVWNCMKNLIHSKEFKNEWTAANPNKKSYDFNLSERTRRSNQNQIYWDFTIDGVDEKFEIKARSTKNGKSQGGYRFSADQKEDKNLIYILVKYSVGDGKIIIGDIDVTRKL